MRNFSRSKKKKIFYNECGCEFDGQLPVHLQADGKQENKNFELQKRKTAGTFRTADRICGLGCVSISYAGVHHEIFIPVSEGEACIVKICDRRVSGPKNVEKFAVHKKNLPSEEYIDCAESASWAIQSGLLYTGRNFLN